jgi:hypothetical protein
MEPVGRTTLPKANEMDLFDRNVQTCGSQLIVNLSHLCQDGWVTLALRDNAGSFGRERKRYGHQ